jgi:hypothetical protein
MTSLKAILAEVDNTKGCHEWPQRTEDDDDYCAGCEIGSLVQKAMMDLEDLVTAARNLVQMADWDNPPFKPYLVDALRAALENVTAVPERRERSFRNRPDPPPSIVHGFPEDNFPGQWEDEYMIDNAGDELGTGPTW